MYRYTKELTAETAVKKAVRLSLEKYFFSSSHFHTGQENGIKCQIRAFNNDLKILKSLLLCIHPLGKHPDLRGVLVLRKD